MVSVRVNFWGRFYFHFSLVYHDLSGFDKTITPLAPRWLSIISYPTRGRGIIVKYMGHIFDTKSPNKRVH